MHLLPLWGKKQCGKFIFGVPHNAEGSHFSDALGKACPRNGRKHALHSRCLLALLEPLAVAPCCSSLVWLGHKISHPQEMPPSGPGRDPSTHTPGGGGGRVDGMLPLCRSRRSGDHLGPSTLPLLAGQVPSPVPLPWPPPSS